MFLMAMALAQASAPTTDLDATSAPKVNSAFASIQAGRPQEALDILIPVVAAYEVRNAGMKERLYCGMSPAETLLYMSMAANDKQNAVALHPGYCDALFLKGYALVDLNRLTGARAAYEKVLSFAPMHAHYLAELGQTYRLEKNWPKMLELCRSALGAAELAEDEDKAREKGLALRCIGYALIEQGKLDEAEAQFRECLKINPDDAKAKSELEYIAEQRKKPA